MEVCIIKDMMGVARNNNLEFKATLTSPIFRRRSTCRAFFCKASLMEDDVKIKVPNGTPKTLIPLDGVVNWDGVLKSSGRLEGDHTTHF
jgi:hypothetical protein